MTEAETKKILKTLETAYPSIRARSQEQADENVRQWSLLSRMTSCGTLYTHG